MPPRNPGERREMMGKVLSREPNKTCASIPVSINSHGSPSINSVM